MKVRIAAPPVEGRANEALVEFLARLFEVARRDVVLVAGETSRQKRFEIRASRVDPASIAG